MNCRSAAKPRVLRVSMCAAAVAAIVCVAQAALAKPGGEPLVLDTQTGIHSGASGTVLQTGPLTGSGMVQARPMANLPELSPQDQPPIVVAPYVSYSASQASQAPALPVQLPRGGAYRTPPH
jgi:hypothetical protein